MGKLLENNIRLEDLRLDFNLKQGDIADILHVKRNTYSKWENCINDMPLEKCNELANYYQVSLDYLLGLSNDSTTTLKPMNLNLFPQRLLSLRKENFLTQNEVGKKVGFTQRAYSHYERGTRVLTTLKLLAIAQFFQVSIDYLVGKTNEKELKKKVSI